MSSVTGPCEICRDSDAVARCHKFDDRALCDRCHVARRLAFICQCISLEDALSRVGPEDDTKQRLAKASAIVGKDKTMKRKPMNGEAGPAAASDEPVVRGEYEELLPCSVPIEDVEVAAGELARVIEERLSVKERKREANAVFREKLAHYDEREKELAAKVAHRTEKRPVMCREVLIARLNEVRVVRLDTGELVSSRAATPEDLQEALPGIDKTEKVEKAHEEHAPAP